MESGKTMPRARWLRVATRTARSRRTGPIASRWRRTSATRSRERRRVRTRRPRTNTPWRDPTPPGFCAESSRTSIHSVGRPTATTRALGTRAPTRRRFLAPSENSERRRRPRRTPADDVPLDTRSSSRSPGHKRNLYSRAHPRRSPSPIDASSRTFRRRRTSRARPRETSPPDPTTPLDRTRTPRSPTPISSQTLSSNSVGTSRSRSRRRRARTRRPPRTRLSRRPPRAPRVDAHPPRVVPFASLSRSPLAHDRGTTSRSSPLASTSRAPRTSSPRRRRRPRARLAEHQKNHRHHLDDAPAPLASVRARSRVPHA